MLSKEEILANIPRLPELKKSREQLTALLGKLSDELRMVSELIQHVEFVTEIIDGEPVHIYSVNAVTTWYRHVTEPRHAEIYLNAHNGKTWGVRLRDYTGVHEYFLGNQYEPEEAKQIARTFVAKGERPCSRA